MGKKIKRSPEMDDLAKKQQQMLEDVGEDRAFEVELDEEAEEIVMVHHYRRKWQDDFDADIEHVLTLEEAEDLVSTLVQMTEILRKARMEKAIETVGEKSTIEPIEKNPMQGNNS